MDLIGICKDALKLSHRIEREIGEKGRKEVHDRHVTDISTQTDRIISQGLIDHFKSKNLPAVLYSEESGKVQLSKNPKLTITFDDLDGTDNFYRGRGILPYCTVVTILDSVVPTFDDIVVAGVIEHNTGDIWHASRGDGCYLNDKKCRTSGRKILDRRTLVVSDHYTTDITRSLDIYSKCWVKDFGCAAFHFIGICGGKADGKGMFDAFINSNQQAHELGAAYLLIKEAGGCIVDWDGNSIGSKKYLFDNRYPVVAAATEELAKEILKYVKRSV